MTDFQERLWAELVRDHAAALSHPRGWRGSPRPLLIVEAGRPSILALSKLRSARLATLATALAAGVAAAVIATSTSTAPSAAFAVTQDSDGTLHVTVDELTGVAGANAELERLGVRVKVVPTQADCPTSGGTAPITPSLVAAVAHLEPPGITVQPRLIPAEDTLVLIARHLGSSVSLGYALYRGSAPLCLPPGYSDVR